MHQNIDTKQKLSRH